MIPLAIPNLAGNEARYLQECVDDNFVSTAGPFVPRFEQMVAQAAGSKYAVATSAGTTGLHVALVAVGVERDDLVILPSWTFIASANAISCCGATPWLFDIEAKGWTLDPDLLEQTLQEKAEKNSTGIFHKATGRKIAAIMPVYTLGMPAQMDRISAIAKKWGIPIVADSAAALGATLHGKPIGEMGADLTVLSFNGNKTLTCGGGGAVIGNDEKLYERVKHLTTTARVGTDYDHDMVGYNYRMTNVSAAIGCAQMEQLDTFLSAKQHISERYYNEFKDVQGLEPFPIVDGIVSACWYSGVVVNMANRKVSDLIAPLQELGVAARQFWKPMHLQEPYKAAPATPMPITDALWPNVLTLPCSTSLSNEDQTTVIDAVKKCLI